VENRERIQAVEITMKSYFEHDGEVFTLDVTPLAEGYQVRFGDRIATVHFARGADGQLTFILDGHKVEAHISSDGKRRWVSFGGKTFVFEKTSGGRRSGPGGYGSGRLAAPMPGQVRAVNVAVGEAVSKGQTLLVLEAMKMEIHIQAPRDGVVERLVVEQGETVEREQVLIEIGEDSEERGKKKEG
jgi:acetyl/propionyl-CoA carboxylase alpha subunit